jgi:hypothetical protein
MHEHFDLITNPFNYKCEISQYFIHSFKKIVVSAKCNSWIVDLTTFKVNDSTHVQMLIIQKMWKKSLTHSSINMKHYVVMCIFIYTSKWNMQHLNNGFNTQSGWFDLGKNVYSSKNVKKITKLFKYNCKILIYMCLIYYNKWKLQFVNNGLNILKVSGSFLIIE